MDPAWINSEITQSNKDTMEQGLQQKCAEENVEASIGSINSYLRKQSTGPIDNLSREDSELSAKETAKGIDEKATATYKSPMATHS